MSGIWFCRVCTIFVRDGYIDWRYYSGAVDPTKKKICGERRLDAIRPGWIIMIGLFFCDEIVKIAKKQFHTGGKSGKRIGCHC